MQNTLHTESLRAALAQRGWTQKDLADQMGVSAQSVTNWFKGKDFPRPDKLLKLATMLHLSFSQLVSPPKDQPIVAFRKKAGTKTTDEHILKALGIGELLKPLVTFLPKLPTLRTQISSPSLTYSRLQSDASQVRNKLGLGDLSVLGYEALIAEFKACGAVLVPVLWGHKQQHKNALHILLPAADVTFVFVNLDTKLEDFKFWMAHELAHVYTPELAGSNEGEDFADAFAASLLFPEACAVVSYTEVAQANNIAGEIEILQRHAWHHQISLNTVFQQTRRYAVEKQLPPLRVDEKTIHRVRNSSEPQMVSTILFEPTPPKPAQYLAAASNVFQSEFFLALKRMIREHATGPSYVQQIMDVSLSDAIALHGELVR
ncbi:XRE family transcriptional regulator [Pseudomonas sp. NBRC 111118]|uniref:XRE family transcriptional regulator n=1 Tax=Pseudomonas sp. NBRC 111118 TaxID=1661033 RepID=UPI0006D41E7E|nr:helix-turn-helix transcriptional regulator [Pseudomonas sp. NBRC 111118]EKT4542414.1 helix-turn-helix transcriptional regulator [Pseudomonas putida]